MTSAERVGEQSREQHYRYYRLFGSDPLNGDGLAELHFALRELGQQADDIHQFLARTEFTSAAAAATAGAKRGDRTAFDNAAAFASAAAAATDGSAQLNIRGAAAVNAYLEAEAAKLSVIPDQGSPDGIAQTLATIDSHQSKSLSTVEQLASIAQHLGQLAQMAGPGPAPAPVLLSQISHDHLWEAPAQSSFTPGPQPLSQPSAAPPAHAHNSLADPLQAPPAPIEHLRDIAQGDPTLPAVLDSPQTQQQQPTSPRSSEHVDVVPANTDNRLQPDARRTKTQHR